MRSVKQLSILPWGMINCYLIKSKSKHILVDTGVPGSEKKIIKQLNTLGIKLEDIGLMIITHGHIDHFGSAPAIQNIAPIPILIHEADKAALEKGMGMEETLKATSKIWDIMLKPQVIKERIKPCKADIVMRGREPFDLKPYGVGGRVIHTPGHTPGSLSIILDDGNAIIMDVASSGILLGGIALNKRMKHPPFHDNMNEVKASLDYILSFNSEQYYLGHGNPVTRKSLQSYKNKLEKIIPVVNK